MYINFNCGREKPHKNMISCGTIRSPYWMRVAGKAIGLQPISARYVSQPFYAGSVTMTTESNTNTCA